MSKTFQVGAGNKVKLFVALLPLGDRTEPEDVTVTAASGITSAATSVTVTALTGAIGGGTPLLFDNGTAKLLVYLTKDALAGATTITIIYLYLLLGRLFCWHFEQMPVSLSFRILPPHLGQTRYGDLVR